MFFSPFSIFAQSTDTITIMVYNLLNFPNGRNDCGTNTVVPARWDTLAKIVNYVQPDILMVCELQTVAGADSILHKALNINGRSSFNRAVFVPNRSSFPTDLNNLVFYDSNKFGLTRQSEILTDTRDVGVYHLYGKDPYLSLHQDTTWLDILVTHLKAGSLSTDAQRRAEECDSIRKYIDTASIARNIVLGGDFNFYTSTEAGFQTLLSGIYPLNDPINMPGSWTNNGVFAPYHTQATRSTSTPSFYDCGSVGGVDDRFDFLLASTPIMTGSNRIVYIPNTYTALGNNGSTFNTRINNPLNTSPVPDSVLNALFYMSDHLPIVMKLQINYPAVILPNYLMSFHGTNQTHGNYLSWLFEDKELNNVDLEYSSDGLDFKKLATIPASDAEYLHETMNSFYYRLKWYHNNYPYYSKIIFIQQNQHIPTVNVFPNPSHDGSFYIHLSNDKSFQDTEISLFNTLGNHLLQTSHDFSTSPQIHLHLPYFQSGVYSLRLTNKFFTIYKPIIFKNN